MKTPRARGEDHTIDAPSDQPTAAHRGNNIAPADILPTNVPITYRTLADAIDIWDEGIEGLQTAKRAAYELFRAQRQTLGMKKASINAEVEALKLAIRMRRLPQTKRQERKQVEEAAGRILREIVDAAAVGTDDATRVARGARAKSTDVERAAEATLDALVDGRNAAMTDAATQPGPESGAGQAGRDPASGERQAKPTNSSPNQPKNLEAGGGDLNADLTIPDFLVRRETPRPRTPLAPERSG
jgi:hypothetical protein